MSAFKRLKSGLKRMGTALVELLPGPPEEDHPPDVDGRRDTDAYGRAAVDAMAQDRVGPGNAAGGGMGTGTH